MPMLCPAGNVAALQDGPDRGLSRRQRVTRSGQFAEAYSQRRKYRGKLMVMWLRCGPDACLRLGVVSSRKVGEATVRVRARRLLREAYRLNRVNFRGNCDVILTALQPIAGASRQDVERDLLGLAARAGILAPQESAAS